jgi:hypothetical protein
MQALGFGRILQEEEALKIPIFSLGFANSVLINNHSGVYALAEGIYHKMKGN